MRRSGQFDVALIQRLEPRLLLHGGVHHDEPPDPEALVYCYNVVVGMDIFTYCCDPSEVDSEGRCPEDPEYDPGPPDPPEEPPEPNPDPNPNDPDPGDPDPGDPPLPNPDPCADYELKIDIQYEGMLEEDALNPPHPQHETDPGGYLPVNRGFSEWNAHWHEDEQRGAAPTQPPVDDSALPLYEDSGNSVRLITGSLPGIGVLDEELRFGNVSISTSGGFSLSGKRVPFKLRVPDAVDLWILYDDDLNDSDPAKWDHVSAGETFYAGGGRPMGFDLIYEGSEAALEETVIALASVNAFCAESNSWRVLRARDDVLVHVVDTELTGDSMNDAGFAPPQDLKDEYIEWLNHERNVASGGKLLGVNDGDQDRNGDGDTIPDFADGFNATDDGRDDLMFEQWSTPPDLFIPLTFTIAAWNHGQVRFWFEYDAADAHYGSTHAPGQDPNESLIDPFDLRRWYDGEQERHHYILGPQGSARLWNDAQAHEARQGKYLDSTEPVEPGGTQQPVYYTHAQLGVTAATGGEITLWLEAVRPSAAVGGHTIKLHAVYDEQHTGAGGTVSLPAHSYVEMKVVPATARDIQVRWVARNTLTDKTNLDANPHLNGGARILPDKDLPNDTLAHDLIDVEVTITPAPPVGTTVYFRAFDVDDPNVDADLVLDPNDDPEEDGVRLPIGGDNRGETPGNRGSFVLPGGAINYGTSATTNAAGKATVTFRTTMQPGDNFRVAAALSNAELDQLTTFEEGPLAGHYYVSPGDQQIDNGQTPGVALTDMLTVWRRLWIERDAMSPPPGTNTVAATVTGLRTAPWPGRTTNYHWLAIDQNLSAHEFEGGTIAIPALGKTVPVVSNTEEFGASEELIIRTADLTVADVAVLTALLTVGGVAVSVTDDDDITVLGAPGAPRLANGGSLLFSAFGDMYVLPVYADSFNTTVMVGFDRHVGDGDFIGDPAYDNSRDLPNQPTFWSSLVVSADATLLPLVILPIPFEAATYGVTSDSAFAENLTLIYLETLRDRADDTTTEAHTLVHELGHSGRDDSNDEHQSTGIMRVGAPSTETLFDNGTQTLIRNKEKW